MHHRVRAALLLASLAALAVAGAAHAARPSPMTLQASLGAGARLGQSTSLRLQLRLDRRLPAVARRLRLRYPAGLDLIGSGLGLASCRPSRSSFEAVAIEPLPLRAGCSHNAVIATGRARGQIRLNPPSITETAHFTLLAGPLQPSGLALVGLVDGVNPIGVSLIYDGILTPSRGRYGGQIDIALPRIPDVLPEESDVALLDVDATIGAADIRYQRRDRHGRIRRWRPNGPVLPTRCPVGGLPFRADVVLSDGTTLIATTLASCPPRRAAPHAGRGGAARPAP